MYVLDIFIKIKSLFFMMVTKEKIGKIQFYSGLLLFLITIIGSIFIIKNVYLGALTTGVYGINGVWQEVDQEINGTLIGLSGHVVSDLILQTQIIRTAVYLYGVSALILIVQSVILILQGLANQSKN